MHTENDAGNRPTHVSKIYSHSFHFRDTFNSKKNLQVSWGVTTKFRGANHLAPEGSVPHVEGEDAVGKGTAKICNRFPKPSKDKTTANCQKRGG